MKSFSKWAGDTHYANMKEIINQIDGIHEQNIQEFAPPQQDVQRAASAMGAGGSGFKTFARTAGRTGVADKMQQVSDMKRRQTLRATLQTLGYSDRQTIIKDIRMIADELGIPGGDQVDDAQGIGGDTAASVTPNAGDMEGMANNGVGV